MKRPEITYPCWWPYTLIGPDEEELRLAIGKITQGEDHRVKFSRESAQKKYVSMHVEVWVVSEDVRDRLFQAFRDHPQIRMVL